METPEEIKKGLECCVAKTTGLTMKDCDIECPYFHEGVFCKNALHGDVKQIIQQLESRLSQVKRERDAAVADLSNSCSFCKHVSGSVDEPPCTDCFHPKNNIVFAPITRTKFEWRGVCPENTKEDPPC